MLILLDLWLIEVGLKELLILVKCWVGMVLNVCVNCDWVNVVVVLEVVEIFWRVEGFECKVCWEGCSFGIVFVLCCRYVEMGRGVDMVNWWESLFNWKVFVSIIRIVCIGDFDSLYGRVNEMCEL